MIMQYFFHSVSSPISKGITIYNLYAGVSRIEKKV